jgi:hypothetical protein
VQRLYTIEVTEREHGKAGKFSITFVEQAAKENID